jgi:hypothetical protein
LCLGSGPAEVRRMVAWGSLIWGPITLLCCSNFCTNFTISWICPGWPLLGHASVEMVLPLMRDQG